MQDRFIKSLYRMPLMVLALCAVVLAGCAGLGQVGPAPQVLDTGSVAEPQATLPPRVPIAIPPVEAAPLLQSEGVIWREKGSLEPSSYASYQWASPPADLLGQRLRQRLSVEGPVVQDNLAGRMPEVRVMLERFEQVFDPAAASGGAPVSAGEIAVRVVLADDSRVIDQLRLSYSIPAASGDASGGARALRAAADAVAESIAQWLSQQPGLRAGI